MMSEQDQIGATWKGTDVVSCSELEHSISSDMEVLGNSGNTW